MDTFKIRFNHVDTDKLSVCFTWDDNFLFHSSLIAPEFIKRGIRCTFYVNPGKEGFQEKYLPGYRALSEMGFEIGSHGFNHDNYSLVPPGQCERELQKAALAIKEVIGIYPSTFAFPYHDFNDETLRTAKKYHLESRNTLPGSRRFGIKADSKLGEMLDFINECVSDGCSAVFSGHSALPDGAQASGSKDSGYGPIPVASLKALLDRVISLDCAQALTFGQAALKRYIADNCEIFGGSFILSRRQLDFLSAFGIDAQRLKLIV